MNDLYTRAYNHTTLNKVIDKLLKKYLDRLFACIEEDLSHYEIQKAGWVASILASSRQEAHKQKAQIFAALIFLVNQNDISCIKLSYILFSRTGNLVATKFLSKLFNNNEIDRTFIHDFGTIIDFELGLKLLDNTLTLKTESFLLTDFQRELWNSLNTTDNISVSAPTSSGKSFIIQNFIKNNFENLDEYSVLYIVPSKALLNQVSEHFRKILRRDTYIKTAYIMSSNEEEELEEIKKVMYILTPERSLNLINQKYKSINPNLIFVDEIQNVEDEEGRGVLMEHVLAHISRLWPLTRK